MPIKINDTLPAYSILENENIFIMTDKRALSQDIRPLKIAILNLMPTKIVTETQLMRLLSNSPLQIEITLVITSTYTPKNTPAEHLSSFYKDFNEVRNEKFDGLIITGAPLEEKILKMFPIGRSSAVFLNGQRKTFILVFISAGVHLRGFTITMVFPRLRSPKSFRVYLIKKYFCRTTLCFADLTRSFLLPTRVFRE